MWFKKKIVGLDIADRSIEAAELFKRGGQIKVAALGRQVLPPGVVERGIIKDEPKLAQAVRDVLGLAKPNAIRPRRLIFGLPEAQVYLYSFTKSAKDWPRTVDGRSDLILREARENVPLAVDDLFVTYQVLETRSAGVNVLLVAMNRSFLETWRNFFQKLGLDVEFELETRALFRSIAPKLAARQVVAIIDFGAVFTQVAVFGRGGLRYSRGLPYGTEMLTEGLVKTLKLTTVEAEQAEREVGLFDPDGKIFTTLLKSLVPLRDELKVTLDYYERWSGAKVEQLFLAGGGSQLRGLADYLRSNLEIPTSVAHSSFLNQPLVYLEAIGLALKGFSGSRQRSSNEAAFILEEGSGGLVKWLGRVFFALIGLAVLFLAVYLFRVQPPSPPPTISPEVIFAPVAPVASTSLMVEETVEEVSETVTVNDTPTDWLNVRSGPGTNFSILTKIYPGDNYPLLAEDGEWYKIELTIEGKLSVGWVNSQYVTRD